eukprot:CAMPEP_0180752216 /NCGR_PEP_ID=MMETSP1038_2-20121128/32031_1 /TAXON_ID=632150 /ORGANISM="Azadinium spinosum, Strain 3D9" /LENGTH=229 /DNA_ID=CAMNT_0022786021 /DNA_START=166 /DNA_END=851 /DNA_ORIENTATION=-
MSACGRAVCPTCRSPMRVDFDTEKERLLFTRSPVAELGEEVPEDNWRSRLYSQAKPLQIKLLQRYGAQVREGVARVAGDLDETIGLALGTISPAAGSGSAPGTAAIAEAPRCVCGCSLRRTSIRERVYAFLSEESAPLLPPPALMEGLMQQPPIVCDICDRQVLPRGMIWTCENGRKTVLHAMSYDACEQCMALHAFSIDLREGRDDLTDAADESTASEEAEDDLEAEA